MKTSEAQRLLDIANITEPDNLEILLYICLHSLLSMIPEEQCTYRVA